MPLCAQTMLASNELLRRGMMTSIMTYINDPQKRKVHIVNYIPDLEAMSSVKPNVR